MKPAPSKARPMPAPAEMRRQMVAYKEQVHELRIQYGKELAVKAAQLLEAKEARARLFATGILFFDLLCICCWMGGVATCCTKGH